MSTAVKDRDLHERITAIDDARGAYPIGKLDAHERNVQHLAVSIFIFRGAELLMQRRASGKYHSGGLWANSVCSHPRWQESAAHCASRRLGEELGWSTELEQFSTIDYAAPVGNGLYENERVHCFVGQIDASLELDGFNPDEVAELDCATIPDIVERMRATPDKFTAWFRIYLDQHLDLIRSLPKSLSA